MHRDGMERQTTTGNRQSRRNDLFDAGNRLAEEGGEHAIRSRVRLCSDGADRVVGDNQSQPDRGTVYLRKNTETLLFYFGRLVSKHIEPKPQNLSGIIENKERATRNDDPLSVLAVRIYRSELDGGGNSTPWWFNVLHRLCRFFFARAHFELIRHLLMVFCYILCLFLVSYGGMD